jgi:hypothetical protein
MRIDGALMFAPDRNTGLSIDTLVVNDPGTLEIGTAADPINSAHSAALTFTDNGPIDTTWDPQQLSRGLLSLGTVSMRGMTRTAFVRLLPGESLSPGATVITLPSVPTDWRLGDSLLLPGTKINTAAQNDFVTLLGISGNQITVSPLTYGHGVPQPELYTYISDLSRNITVQSANPSDITGHGHTMFMSAATDVEGVQFLNLGRTNKSVALSDPQFDSSGNLIAGTGTNPRGRYAVHFHRIGTDITTSPAEVNDCVVMNGPGWGYVNHSSYVNFDNDIAYNVVGSGFVTEAGDEIGRFSDDMAVHDVSSRNMQDFEDQSTQDYGRNGIGFSLQGWGNTVTGCVVMEPSSTGYFWGGIPLIQKDPVTGAKYTTQFASANLPDPSLAGGKISVSIQSVPLGTFYDNTVTGSQFGVWMDYLQVTPLAPTQRSFINDFLAWNMNIGSEAMVIHYSNDLTVENSKIVGNDLLLYHAGGTGIAEGNEATSNNIYSNDIVQGESIGIFTAQQGNSTITGGYYDNIINIEVPSELGRGGNVITISNPTFPQPAPGLAGHADIKIYFDFGNLMGHSPAEFFVPTIVMYNGRQVYAPEQDPNYIPFPTSSAAPGLPAAMVGLTNQQLLSQFGLAFGGALAPAGSTPLGNISGVVGSPATYPPLTMVASYTSAPHTSPYMLIVYVWNSTTNNWMVFRTPNITLQTGWNMITETVFGRLETFFIFGQ